MPIAEKVLPLSPGPTEWVAVWQSRPTLYGTHKKLRSDVVLYKRLPGAQPKKVAIYPAKGKGSRHWLKAKAAGKPWYWHRLVAWCFCNPRNLSWTTYHKKLGNGHYEWQAGHLSRKETDCTAKNLLVMTRNQNLAIYKGEAADKHKTVFRG